MKNISRNLFLICLIPLVALSTIGFASGHWYDSVNVNTVITTANLGNPCIEIQKVLQGSFTNTCNGKDTAIPTDKIAISACFPTKFKMTINVTNCGTSVLTDVIVKDTIGPNLTYINYTMTKGSCSWFNHTTAINTVEQNCPIYQDGTAYHDLTWDIGTLNPGQNATFVIWVCTVCNSHGIYAPTGTSLQFNAGATVVANSILKTLSATTAGITIKVDANNCGSGIILTKLPYSTPWAMSN